MLKNIIIVCGLFISLLGAGGCAGGAEELTNSPFIKAEGRLLKKEGETILLQGICFSNYYYHPEIDLTTSKHHQEIDFQRVKEMGMNTIRFGLNGNSFESAPGVFDETAFQWLDTRLEWAEKYGIHLILDMHVPIGGDWLSAVGEKDFSIWTDPAVEQRFVNLWKEIAKRYKDNPWIAAYNILNEPITVDTTGESWKALAEKTVKEIRNIDKNHMLLIERLYGTNGKFQFPQEVEQQFLVDDDNVVYDFHLYMPSEYTHQYAYWVENPKDGGTYPDPKRLSITDWDSVTWKGTANSEQAAAGTSDWTYYEGPLVQVTDEAILVGVPNVIVEGANSGKVYFDKFIVKEYDSVGNYIQDILIEDITAETIGDWYDWTYGEGADIGTSMRIKDGGYNDDYCLELSNTAVDAGWSNGYKLFAITTGNQYQVCGYMKTVDLPAEAKATLTLTFYAEPGPDTNFIAARDKELLRSHFEKWMQFGIDNNVPMSVTEFGTINFTFGEKGGLTWVSDMVDLLQEYDLSFTYWQYHSDDMGMYYGGPEAFPSSENANTELIELFTEKLNP